jgi:SAM-dependent methyltransferase
MATSRAGGTSASALERARELLADPEHAGEGDRGYLDLIGTEAPASTGPAQDLMVSRVVPMIYERLWRPALGRVAKGPLGPSMRGEYRLAADLLRLEPAKESSVLDVACGTGNFTRALARSVAPPGLVVGIDVSETMLDRAVSDTRRSGLENVAFVRGDADALPFADRSFDAVCCFAALHLFADPARALNRFTAVLRPGGRVAILTSVRRAPWPLRLPEWALGAAGGMRLFGGEELRDALRRRGFEALEWELAGAAQIVGARRA